MIRTAPMRLTTTKTPTSSGLFWKKDLETVAPLALLDEGARTVAVTIAGAPLEPMAVLLNVGVGVAVELAVELVDVVEDMEENVEDVLMLDNDTEEDEVVNVENTEELEGEIVRDIDVRRDEVSDGCDDIGALGMSPRMDPSGLIFELEGV